MFRYSSIYSIENHFLEGVKDGEAESRIIRRSNLVLPTLTVGTGIPLVVVNMWLLVTRLLDIVTINVAIGGWTILVRMTTPASYTTLLDRFYGRGSLGLILLIKEQCFDHIFEFEDIGRDSGGGGSVARHF
ncbi:hypothetical protein Tco_0866137 [Tanacetum coccineum]